LYFIAPKQLHNLQVC